MNPQPKIKPKRNKDYLDFIRSQPSITSGRIPSDPHHIRRSYFGSGTSIKPHDYCCIPVDRPHTADVEKYFDCTKLISKYLFKYIVKKYGVMETIDLLINVIERKRRQK